MYAVLEERARVAQRGRAERQSGATLSDPQQQLTVRRRVPVVREHAGIAIHFDRQAEAPQLPPHHRVPGREEERRPCDGEQPRVARPDVLVLMRQHEPPLDRKSTRLNSSHGYISYAVFCLKKKTKKRESV